MYRIFTFREFKSIHKGKTAILHLCFSTEKNRRLGSKKSPIYSGFSQETSFLSPHYGADGSFARLASALADTHTAAETATGCFFASQPPFRISPPAPIKKSRRQKAVGIFGADGEIRTLAAVTHPTPLAGAPRHQLEYICKTVNLNTHCQVVAPIRCLINIPKRSKKVNKKFI